MTAFKMPAHASEEDADKYSLPNNAVSSGFHARCAKTRRSALWAAYGDALGWISELTDSKGLRKRTGGAPLCHPIEWTRRIGGRSGITTLLPEGCYSDDSQLRLATGRAISPRGFDVEAFAKIELPVWLSYGLGGGKSTSAAAVHLSKIKVAWFANTFKGWSNSGGNGAAMRIQPHVWATSGLDDPECYLLDVVRNTICTHSHPIGLIGSVIHALALAHAMATSRVPSVNEMLAVTEIAARLPKIMQKDIEVDGYWRGGFERDSGSFDDAWNHVIKESQEALEVAGESVSGVNAAERYAALVDRLRLRDPSRRGSGMLTAIASVGLLWCDSEPEKAMRIAANELGTDTDTIASMAGALVGATADSEPPNEVLDAALFRSEADRLTKIACGMKQETHRYPDLLHWSPPSQRADTLVRTRDGGLYVRGLGPAQKISDAESSSNGHFQWQWLKLEIGQSLLIKRRPNLTLMKDDTEVSATQGSLYPMTGRGGDLLSPAVDQRSTDQRGLPETLQPDVSDTTSKQTSSLNLQVALDYMVDHIDDDKAVGGAIRRVVEKGTRGQIAAFTAFLIDELGKTKQTKQRRLD